MHLIRITHVLVLNVWKSVFCAASATNFLPARKIGIASKSRAVGLSCNLV